jgi:hypothetical protein
MSNTDSSILPMAEYTCHLSLYFGLWKFNLVFKNHFSFFTQIAARCFSFMTVITACSCSLPYVLRMQSSTMWLLYDNLKLAPRIQWAEKLLLMLQESLFKFEILTWMGNRSQKNGTLTFVGPLNFEVMWEGVMLITKIWNVNLDVATFYIG